MNFHIFIYFIGCGSFPVQLYFYLLDIILKRMNNLKKKIFILFGQFCYICIPHAIFFFFKILPLEFLIIFFSNFSIHWFWDPKKKQMIFQKNFSKIHNCSLFQIAILRNAIFNFQIDFSSSCNIFFFLFHCGHSSHCRGN